MNRKNYIPTEQISERKENVKTYLVGPGLRHAFAASIPLHVRQEDGSWSPVNAVFQWDKESSGYISHGSRFTTACSVPNPAPFITVTDHKNHSLSWGIEGAGPVAPEIFRGLREIRDRHIHPGIMHDSLKNMLK